MIFSFNGKNYNADVLARHLPACPQVKVSLEDFFTEDEVQRIKEQDGENYQVHYTKPLSQENWRVGLYKIQGKYVIVYGHDAVKKQLEKTPQFVVGNLVSKHILKSCLTEQEKNTMIIQPSEHPDPAFRTHHDRRFDTRPMHQRPAYRRSDQDY